ncbi:MAG: heme exporter protein CcmD [Gammaproteobacteria bacterium]|nr:heme exporter protein CcmD [Gammaproteobacteria bacterium]MCP5135637.1 heme exporter protein CcmD [Gammaproteobacteria bacterium]
MNEFFSMGGYAAFVWPSYGLGLVILIAHIAAPTMRRRRLLSEIARCLRREARAAAKAESNEGSKA